MKQMIRNAMFAGLTGIFLASCGAGPSGDKVTSGEAASVSSAASIEGTYIVDAEKSVIEWEGAKIAYSHNGLISLSSGELSISDGRIVGGSFTIDMNSIVCLDIEDPEKNANLVGHLQSPDFFEVETYPFAKFEIASSEHLEGDMHSITGNLTLKDVTRSITIPAKVSINDNTIQASAAQFVIDRSEWNVRFGSPTFFNDLKDDFIKDEIGLAITLIANRS